MKILKASALSLLTLGFFACGGSSSDETAKDLLSEISESLEELDNEAETWSTKSDNENFEIDIPAHMQIMDNLNAEASLQYGYAEQVGDEVLEHYVIVLNYPKEDLKADGFEDMDILTYNKMPIESLSGGLDEYELITTEPKVEDVNGLKCVKNEMRGSLGEVNIYYQVGVYESDKSFYQLVTWCIEGQKGEFKEDMERIINSFKEI